MLDHRDRLLNRGDFDAFGDLFADEGIWETGEPFPRRAAGKENVKTMLRTVSEPWDFFQMTHTGVIDVAPDRQTATAMYCDPLVRTHDGSRRSVAVARTRRVVFVSLATQILETAALGAAAIVTGSSALVAQTFAAGSDIAVQMFLVVGVGQSLREPDETHPFGYGRERYFWSLFGALAVFVSGFAVAIQEALRGALSRAEVSGFAVGYLVLGVTLVLEIVAFCYSLREVRLRAHAGDESVSAYLRSTTEPATTTELIGNGIGLAGGILATVALALTQVTGSRWPDVIASGLIGVALMAAAVALTQQNRALLTGRGVSPRLLEAMRSAIAAQPGVVEIPGLLAVVIGPAMLAVEGDVTFDDALTVPEVETALSNMETELRSHWPDVRYVYLTPVATQRPDDGESTNVRL